MARTKAADRFSTELTVAMGPTDLTASVLTTAGSPASPTILVIDHDVPAKAEIVLFDGTFDGTTFRTTNLANRYLPNSAAGSGITHDVGAKVIFATLGSHHEEIWNDVAAHTALTATAHGATASATVNTLVRRDASGRAQFASPSAAGDAAIRSYVDLRFKDVVHQVFNSSGTWTKPSGALKVHVVVVGGGGGAASIGSAEGACGCGGGGGYAEAWLDASALAATEAVTVGGGGAGGIAAGGNGSTGGTSSFDKITGAVMATGGLGGERTLSAPPVHADGGAGGTGSGGDLHIKGSEGGDCYVNSGPGLIMVGDGGSAAGFPSTYRSLRTFAGLGGNGVNATTRGSGGIGGGRPTPGASLGGNGAAGIVIVTTYIG